jgi:hypothetical protein
MPLIPMTGRHRRRPDGSAKNEPIALPEYTEIHQVTYPADHIATGTIFAPAAPGVVRLFARPAGFVVEARSS